MDKKLGETTHLCVEIINSKRQVKGKLGHVVQVRVCRLTSLLTRSLFGLLTRISSALCRVRKINQSETYTGSYLLDTSSWMSFRASFTAEDIFVASILHAFV